MKKTLLAAWLFSFGSLALSACATGPVNGLADDYDYDVGDYYGYYDVGFDDDYSDDWFYDYYDYGTDFADLYDYDYGVDDFDWAEDELFT